MARLIRLLRDATRSPVFWVSTLVLALFVNVSIRPDNAGQVIGFIMQAIVAAATAFSYSRLFMDTLKNPDRSIRLMWFLGLILTFSIVSSLWATVMLVEWLFPALRPYQETTRSFWRAALVGVLTAMFIVNTSLNHPNVRSRDIASYIAIAIVVLTGTYLFGYMLLKFLIH